MENIKEKWEKVEHFQELLEKENLLTLKLGKNELFWKIVKGYLYNRKEKLKNAALMGLDEGMSELKYNRRDLILVEMQLIDEMLRSPETIITLIENKVG